MYQEVFQLHADLLKAVAHPKRLEIINLLRDQELSVSEIQGMLDLPQANLSQHLQVLRDHEVLVTRRAGKQIYYKLTHKNFIKACDLVRDIMIERYSRTPLVKELSAEISKLVPIVTDPVCGMRLSMRTAATSKQHKGTRYYFCAAGCQKRFLQRPRRYVQLLDNKHKAYEAK